MSRSFRPHKSDALFPLPPDVRDWLKPGHPALFFSGGVEMLDLHEIVVTYKRGTGTGSGLPSFHPAMMVKLLIYGYCCGQTSSRRMERATYDEAPYRVLAANQHLQGAGCLQAVRSGGPEVRAAGVRSGRLLGAVARGGGAWVSYTTFIPGRCYGMSAMRYLFALALSCCVVLLPRPARA